MMLRRVLLAVRRLTLAVMLALACATAVFLPFAGRYLVREDPLVGADVIVVLDGARAERWMEAVDLYKAGYAPVIVLSPGRMEDAEVILRARGIRYPTNASLARDAMVQMGVNASAIILPEASVDNTGQEAEMLRAQAAARGWRSILVITSKYHSRRAGFAFRREFRESGIAISLRTTRYDVSDPAHWWRHRADMRYVLSELQKLIVYRLGVGG
ncbi:MAG: hypothetical protein DMF84_22950 [Acidobacteria bacterium]|nr:MAG: hypothetical protein DMF84_22950 [Acidobacteriota bacterium]